MTDDHDRFMPTKVVLDGRMSKSREKMDSYQVSFSFNLETVETSFTPMMDVKSCTGFESHVVDRQNQPAGRTQISHGDGRELGGCVASWTRSAAAFTGRGWTGSLTSLGISNQPQEK